MKLFDFMHSLDEKFNRMQGFVGSILLAFFVTYAFNVCGLPIWIGVLITLVATGFSIWYTIAQLTIVLVIYNYVLNNLFVGLSESVYSVWCEFWGEYLIPPLNSQSAIEIAVSVALTNIVLFIIDEFRT